MNSLVIVIVGALLVSAFSTFASRGGRGEVSYRVSDQDTAPWIGNLTGAETTEDGKVVCLYRSGTRTAYYITDGGVCHKYALMAQENPLMDADKKG